MTLRERVARAIEDVRGDYTIVCFGGDYAGTCELQKFIYNDAGKYTHRDTVFQGTHDAVEFELDKLCADAAIAALRQVEPEPTDHGG